MKRNVLGMMVLGMAAQARAGAVLELVPDQAGPYLPGQAVGVEVWMHNQEAFAIDLRLVILDVQGLLPRLYAGGDFVTSGGVTVNHVAKFTGGAWTAIDQGVDSSVHTLGTCTLNGGTTLYAGGVTWGMNNYEAKVHRMEAGWWTELQRFGLGHVDSLLCAKIGSGAELFVGGYIWQSAAGIYGVVPWNGDDWNPMPGLQGAVNDMMVFDDGSGPALYAAGDIIATMPAPHVLLGKIGKWTGTNWAPLGGGIGNGYLSPAGPRALAVYDDGTGLALFVAGDFRDVYQVTRYVGDLQVNNIAKWDGSVWSSVGGGTTPNAAAPIYDLVVFDDGTGPALYAAGDFNFAGGVSVKNIARWNGTSWSDVGGGVTGDAEAAIHTLAVLDDGSGPVLYAGGWFTNAGGVPVSNVAKWNGTTWSPVGAGFDDTVRALEVHEATGSPNLTIEGSFQFDFSTLTDGGAEYNLWPGLPGPILIYTGLGPIPGSMLHVPAGGSLRLGELQVVTPNTPGVYKLDVTSPYGPRGGSIISFGFGGPNDPYTDWLAESGDITGNPIPFSVQTGPPNPIPAVSEWGMVVLTLLLLVAATFVFARRHSLEHSTVLALVFVTCVHLCPIPVFADTFKQLNICNPHNAEAKGMRVTFTLKHKQGEGPTWTHSGTEPPQSTPSEHFLGVTGTGSNTLTFGGGSLAAGSRDRFKAGFEKNLKDVPNAPNLVTKVELLDEDGAVIYTLDQSDADKKKEFRKNVTGFTNEELFDFTSIESGTLHLRNSDASLNLRYMVSNLEIYTNLPISNFTISAVENSGPGTLAFFASQVQVNPGDDLVLTVGMVSPGTYVLASASGLEVEDLTTSEITDFPFSQYYAQSVVDPDSIPAVSEWGMIVIMLLLLVAGTLILGTRHPSRIQVMPQQWCRARPGLEHCQTRLPVIP